VSVLNSIFKPFVEKSPICVMAAGALRRLLSAERLDALFERSRVSQYAHRLLFSKTFDLMGSMVSGSRKTVHHSYQTAEEPVGVSVTAVYGKLKGIEPCTSQALVREVGAEVSALIDQFGQAAQGGQASGEGVSLSSQSPAPLYPPVLPGYHTKILDGNCIEATHHRIKELRATAAGALPGKSLVVLDADRRVICDVFPCEDGHAQERALLGEVIPTIKPKELWIDDRNFCTFEMLWETNVRGAFFVTRRHGNMACESVGERRLVGRSETGTVYEQTVLVRGEGGRELRLRRVDVELDKSARDGDKVLSLLSNLPAEGEGAVDALTIAGIYRKRWGIETAFQELAGHFESEINSLGYPRAALFGFCVAIVLFNAVSLLRAALAATHGTKKVQEEVSSYYIAAELETTSRGMMIAVPPEQWEVFAKMTDAEFIAVMMMLAGKVNLRHFKKHPRGPKKPQPKRTYDPAHPHVATARELAKRSPRKRRSTLATHP
jgi:IS4 transposase